MKGTRWFTLLVVTAGLLSACFDPKAEKVSTGMPSGPISIDQFQSEYPDVVWDAQAVCFPMLSEYYVACSKSAYRGMVGIDEKSIEAGRITFDPAKAGECIHALRTSPCEGDPLAICAQAVQPGVEPGGECYADRACIHGWCDRSASCPGVCVAYAREGESCPNAVCCPDCGLYCDELGDGSCHSLKAAGSTCSHGYECEWDLACSLEGRCTERRGVEAGESCAFPEAYCRKGLYCAGGADNPMTCKPFLAAGEACAVSSSIGEQSCGPLACAGYFRKGSTENFGRCAPWSEEGGPCVEIEDDGSPVVAVTGCKTRLICQSGTCKVPPVSGPCHSANDCDQRVSYCSGTECLPKKELGSTCADDSQCVSDRCVQSKCEVLCRP